MVYEGINFNEDWVKSKTQDEFLAEVKINTHWWPNDSKRIEKAISFYSLIMPKAKAGPKKPAKAITDKEQDNDVHRTTSDDQQV